MNIEFLEFANRGRVRGGRAVTFESSRCRLQRRNERNVCASLSHCKIWSAQGSMALSFGRRVIGLKSSRQWTFPRGNETQMQAGELHSCLFIEVNCTFLPSHMRAKRANKTERTKVTADCTISSLASKPHVQLFSWPTPTNLNLRHFCSSPLRALPKSIA